MEAGRWSPWKVVTVGLAVIVTTALITGLVVENWNEKEPPRSAAIDRPASSATTVARPARGVATGPSAPPPVSPTPVGALCARDLPCMLPRPPLRVRSRRAMTTWRRRH